MTQVMVSERVGIGGWESGRKDAGGRRREGDRWDSRGGGKQEKLRKILQHFVIEMGQSGGNHYRKGWEAGVKGIGRGSRRYEKLEAQAPLSVPPPVSWTLKQAVIWA